MKKMKIRPWYGLFGLLGFLGCLYFVFQEAFLLCFFSFFGFFAFYWEGKMQGEQADERLIANQLKAKNRAAVLSWGPLWVFFLFAWPRLPQEIGYPALGIAVALCFGLQMVLNSYLTYRFDKEES